MGKKIRIGTRGSKLALWQANYAKSILENLGYESELVTIFTQGDKMQNLGLDKLEGKGFFTKELEHALVAGEIDMAVHSMKDLPTEKIPELTIAGVSERANPADWLIYRKEAYDPKRLFKLKISARIGTSSLRRKVQIKAYRPDVEIIEIRGNVPTRLEKLEKNNFDGLILAAAGLERLQIDLSNYHVVRFSPKEFIPAPAQGVLAYQIVKTNQPLKSLIKHIHMPDVSKATNIERKVMQLLGGGCNTPVGVYCYLDTMGNYHAWGVYAPEDPGPLIKTQVSYSTKTGLAEAIAENLLKE